MLAQSFSQKITSAALIIPLLGTVHTASLANQLKGRILLQVESHGEAWYVHPSDNKRYYLPDGDTAYTALRTFGLGISNANIAKIPVGFESRLVETDSDNDGLSDRLEDGLGTKKDNPDTDGDGYKDGEEIRNGYSPFGPQKLVYDTKLANGLKGKILLQVEAHGEAWYLNPVDGKRYYMNGGEAAYQIMRYLSLGITNANLNQILAGPSLVNPKPQPISDTYLNYALAICYGKNNPDASTYFPAGILRDDYLVALSSTDNDCSVFSSTQINASSQLLTTDVDKDGLNSLLESIYGTSDQKADTDADGISDLQEAQLNDQVYAWDSVSTQIKYQSLVHTGTWSSPVLASRIDGFSMPDSIIASLGAPVTLKQEVSAACINSRSVSGYLRFEGDALCATGYFLQATGKTTSLKIDSGARLTTSFAPVSSPAEAVSFVVAVTPGLKVNTQKVPLAEVIITDNGYLVRVTVSQTLGVNHPEQKIIYFVTTSGTVTSLAYER